MDSTRSNLKDRLILYNDNNTRSKKLAERLSFRLETKALGLIENHLGDELATGCMYAKFNSDGLSKQYIRW